VVRSGPTLAITSLLLAAALLAPVSAGQQAPEQETPYLYGETYSVELK